MRNPFMYEEEEIIHELIEGQIDEDVALLELEETIF